VLDQMRRGLAVAAGEAVRVLNPPLGLAMLRGEACGVLACGFELRPTVAADADAASSWYSATIWRPLAAAAARRSASCVGMLPRWSAVDFAA
jgi:hypothetical protein